jgi:hypothetical protein
MSLSPAAPLDLAERLDGRLEGEADERIARAEQLVAATLAIVRRELPEVRFRFALHKQGKLFRAESGTQP